MAQTLALPQALSENVTWNKARINFLAKFIIALIQVKTVSLWQIAAVMPATAKADSHYKRCQRFFRFFDLPFAEIARMVLRLLKIKPPFVILIDRTDWYLGETPLNVFLLSVCFKGAAFPLLWTVLPKKGCSNQKERIALLNRYVDCFGADSILFLAADREFLGKQWFKYLARQKIRFRIRLKENLLVSTARGNRAVAAKNLFRAQTPGVPVLLAGKRSVLGAELFVMGMRSEKGESVLVASNEERRQILADYALRWKIETLFGCLKSRGFCLEATHLTDKERLEKLLAWLTIAYSWAFLVGEWLTQIEPLKIKKHGRLAKSVFRHGIDYLGRILCNQDCFTERSMFIKLCQLLSCT